MQPDCLSEELKLLFPVAVEPSESGSVVLEVELKNETEAAEAEK